MDAQETLSQPVYSLPRFTGVSFQKLSKSRDLALHPVRDDGSIGN